VEEEEEEEEEAMPEIGRARLPRELISAKIIRKSSSKTC
jgi:hypothetical protein